jgi:hypothetical protein
MQSQEKPTKFGIISSILVVLLGVLWCVYVFILMIYTQREVTSIALIDSFVAVLLIYGGVMAMTLLTIMLTISGMVLGVLSLRKGEPKRFFAIAGFVINFLWLLSYCLPFFSFFTSFDS